ncbi:N-acetylmuramidase domain-containing protein [Flavobacterium terrigena]|uniref:Putative peptidoglycan binding domain-containing protein n=1 Tax=Flavobacterium terrigena TaxID=402734 RepID=A0A1H6VDS7_9FLAO|nr:N-acetylmuramidase family protein [Flavobacterium terrigena]SEJ02708.1 Putative peptidoglycan binding domain-containing protein [Flavobacterium terrigena]
MKTIKYNVKTPEVVTLCEMLNNLGYNLVVSNSFTLAVDEAVKNFQAKNNLVVDGIVGMKSWSKLYELNAQFTNHNDKFLSEQDLMNFANTFQLELATVKAVNEIESSGKGFLLSGKPKILFEGHIFWKELEKRGINPNNYCNSNTTDVLYKSWTKQHYVGGEGEHVRLQKAMQLGSDQKFIDAANASASWGCFQIMGFHALPLGYTSIDDFVQKMYVNEDEHLNAFGRFLSTNHLIPFLQNKDWSEFARRYNGAGYKVNKYDTKLANAYAKYSK